MAQALRWSVPHYFSHFTSLIFLLHFSLPSPPSHHALFLTFIPFLSAPFPSSLSCYMGRQNVMYFITIVMIISCDTKVIHVRAVNAAELDRVDCLVLCSREDME